MNQKIIGTHDGQFHLDEVAACMMLTNYTDTYKNAKIIRTRNLQVLNTCNIVVDVGGKYNPQQNLFDHHQREFTDKFSSNHSIRLSSAGLIYKHFGQEILKNIMQNVYNMNSDNQFVDLIYMRLYDKFIQYMDGIDNGVQQFEVQQNEKYTNGTSLHNRVGRLNIEWNEQGDEMARFNQAMSLVQEEWMYQIKKLVFHWYPARPIVQKAIESRNEVHESLKIIKLDQICPWKEHLYELENELKIENILFVIFQGKDDWRVQAVSQCPTGFSNRKSLKNLWRGIQDQEKLAQVSQIQDIVFCHNTGFIGGAKSYESALKMAIQSLNEID